MCLIKTIKYKSENLEYHRILSACAFPDIGGGRIEAKIASYKNHSARQESEGNFLTKQNILIFDKNYENEAGETPYSSLDLNGDIRAQAYAFAMLTPQWEGATSDE